MYSLEQIIIIPRSWRFLAGALLVWVMLLPAGCNKPMPDMNLEPEINKLFTAIQAADFETALGMYSDEFYKGIPKEYWRAQLVKFNELMGPMERINIRSKQVDTRFSGKFFIFQLDTIHKDQKKARHIVTFVLPVDGGDIKLVGHKISAKGFS